MPSEPITGVDHAIVLVRDLDRAAAAYRRLGFTLTERGRHTRLGTHNHCMMLERDYFELLAIAEPGPANARWAAVLADREGPAAIALATDDAAAGAAALAARGVTLREPMRFSRPVRLADGTHDASFVTAYVEPDSAPVAPMFFCEQVTRHLVWRPEWQRHANGATGLAGLLAVHPRPMAVADAYRRLVGADRVAASDDLVTVRLGACALDIASTATLLARTGGVAPAPSAAPVRLVGLTIRVADREAAARLLAAAGVHAAPDPAGDLLVPPAEACGAVLRFTASI